MSPISPILPEEKITIEQLALDIADESECNVIECAYLTTILEGKEWYDTTTGPSTEPEPLRRAERYLTLRDLLERHPTRPELVRIPNACDLGQDSLDFLSRS